MRASARLHAVLATSAIVMATALAVAGCGGGGTPDASKLVKKSIPAEVVKSPQTFLGSESLGPIQNAWRTSNTKRFTQVEAGAVPSDDAVGAFAIFHYSFRNAAESANLVKVIGAGALTITKAPTGSGAEATSQRHGKIEFSSENGARGTLDLSDDSIRLDTTPWKPAG
jgi:hypothetical protein